MKTTYFPAALLLCVCLHARAAMPLTESTFTEIIREANVLTATDKSGKPAKANDLFKVPDLVRTGPASRVELTAKDKTITRVGANTIFTFEQGGRDIQLQQGGVLFHAPAGAGGGAIKYHGTSAAVLGTTELAQILPGGLFKVLDLEGHVKVTLQNKQSITLKPGQLVIVSADGTTFGKVLNFNLAALSSHLLLVVGFSAPLSSKPLIVEAIQVQNEQIAAGQLDALISLEEAGDGLDIGLGSSDDLFPGAWNPLDFPGNGPIGPTPGGPGSYPLVPPGAPPGTIPPIVNPPHATEPSFQATP